MLAELDGRFSAGGGGGHGGAEIVFVEVVEVGGGAGAPALVGEGGVVGAHQADDFVVGGGGPDALELLLRGEVDEDDVVGVGTGGSLGGALVVEDFDCGVGGSGASRFHLRSPHDPRASCRFLPQRLRPTWLTSLFSPEFAVVDLDLG